MEEEAQEQDGEVRVSSYIDDEGYVHETQVRVRMVRIETEEERRQRDEDEESENSLTTDYGSLEGHIEPVGDYEHLEDDAYQAYRLEQIENDVGIEVYIIMKVRQFRQMMEEDSADEDIPTGYEMFRELQRMLMITGAETRKEVTDYIRSLRQYTYHVKKGHEDVNCPLEESEWPDGWMAANWGPPRMLREFRMPPRRQQRRRRDESSSSEEHDAAAAFDLQDRGRDDPMILDEPEPEIE